MKKAIALGLVGVTLAEESCVVNDAQKINCGYLGIKKYECEYQRGCCWQELEKDSETPWCFFNKEYTEKLEEKKEERELQCSSNDDEKEDCGILGTTEQECIENGCCWKEAHVENKNVPWCYKMPEKKVIPEVVTIEETENTVKENLKNEIPELEVPETEPKATQEAEKEIPTIVEPEKEQEKQTAEDPLCVIEDSEKVDCGVKGTTQEECETKGCCWKDTGVVDDVIPYCFRNKEYIEECTVDDSAKIDCGDSKTTQEECENKGCCWKETGIKNDEVPYCFRKANYVDVCAIDEDNRTDCGFFGINQQTCEEKGCCWRTSNKQGVPWCFNSLKTDEVPEA